MRGDGPAGRAKPSQRTQTVILHAQNIWVIKQIKLKIKDLKNSEATRLGPAIH